MKEIIKKQMEVVKGNKEKKLKLKMTNKKETLIERYIERLDTHSVEK